MPNIFVGSSRRMRIALLLAVAGLLSPAVFSAGELKWSAEESRTERTEHFSAPVSATSQIVPPSSLAIDRAQLDHHVVRALDALGDRFETPGKARTVMTATLTRHTGAAPGSTSVVVAREFPDKVRFEEQTLSGVRVLAQDGTRFWAQSGSPSKDDAAFIESLVRDSIEHFMAGQELGDATLDLGDMFRLDDGSDPNYPGPFYDILRVEDTFGAAAAPRSTLYYLNSRTGLPEKIVYESQAGRAVRVEVEFGDWMTISGQKVPRRTVWKEDGATVAELVVSQVVFTSAIPDGIFNASRGQ